jgi:hypothetical protein
MYQDVDEFHLLYIVPFIMSILVPARGWVQIIRSRQNFEFFSSSSNYHLHIHSQKFTMVTSSVLGFPRIGNMISIGENCYTKLTLWLAIK